MPFSEGGLAPTSLRLPLCRKHMRHIERDDYHVFDWADRSDLSLDDFWRMHPEVVVGRFLVNTSLDSGHLILSDEQRREGWRAIGELAHSPRIRSIEQIPHIQFDEWLVFDTPTEVTAFETMVNYCDFTPIDFSWEEKRERYWQQVLRYRPLHIIAENHHMYLVSRDAEFALKILKAEADADGNAAAPHASA